MSKLLHTGLTLFVLLALPAFSAATPTAPPPAGCPAPAGSFASLMSPAWMEAAAEVDVPCCATASEQCQRLCEPSGGIQFFQCTALPGRACAPVCVCRTSKLELE